MHNILAQLINIGGGSDGGPAFSVPGPTGFTLGSEKIGGIIGRSLSYIFAFAGIGLLIMIIASGFTLMTSVGDPKKMEKGKATLTNAIIGFILIFAAFWIVQIVGVVFGWQSSIGAIFGQ